MNYPNLLTEGKIGNLVLPNRLVFPPFQTRAADEHGLVTERLIRFLTTRAKTGIGLVIVQHSFCWEGSGIDHGIDISTDACIKPLSKLVKAVKETGAKVGIQIGGRTLRQGDNICYAPSSFPISFEKNLPTPLTKEQLHTYLEYYSQAALRIHEAGFDTIELHGLTGKLLAQMLSPYFNRRTDEYGGSVENRTRFPREVMQAIHSQIGINFPIIFGLTMDEGIEGGVTPEDAINQAKWLEKGGAAAFFVSLGTQEKRWYAGSAYMYTSHRLNLGLQLREATKLPILVDGKIKSLEQAESLCVQGAADFVGICRPIVADPEFLSKSFQKRNKDIRHCLYCSNCMTWPQRPYVRGFGTCCTVNPETFREGSFEIIPTANPRRITIIGAGLAGMEVAATLAERGHHVELYEKNKKMGGQWLVASHGEHKEDFRTIIPYLTRRMEHAGVTIHLESKMTPEEIYKLNTDCLILATGATPREFKGEKPKKNGPLLLQGNDVIMGAQTGNRVLVVGARYIGMEVALKLAAAKKHVSLIDINGIGESTIDSLGEWYRKELVNNGVYMYPQTYIMRVTSTGADVSYHHSMISLPEDTIVFAIGTIPDQSLLNVCRTSGKEFHLIGDCSSIGDALKAIRDGAELGRKL